MSGRIVRRLAMCLLMAPLAPASAQVIDEGEFSIRLDGREIGREQFSIRSGRGPDGNTAGTTITAVTRYPAIDPQATFTTVLERSPGGRFTVFQLEYDARDGSERYLGAQDRGRITIHRFAGDDREAREFPGGATAYVMVDSVYALHYVLIDFATDGGSMVTAYFPRTNRRRSIEATNEATATGLRVRLSGDLSATILLDSARRIRRIDFPGTSLSVVRLED